MESVLTTVKRGRIAIFTLNRPEKYNALNPALIQALEEAMLDFMEDPDLYVGILTGAGGFLFRRGRDRMAPVRQGHGRPSMAHPPNADARTVCYETVDRCG